MESFWENMVQILTLLVKVFVMVFCIELVLRAAGIQFSLPIVGRFVDWLMYVISRI